MIEKILTLIAVYFICLIMIVFLIPTMEGEKFFQILALIILSPIILIYWIFGLIRGRNNGRNDMNSIGDYFRF